MKQAGKIEACREDRGRESIDQAERMEAGRED